ncbi:hypothetical protein IFO70_23410 [Phormidium tenue FACHB-886]|nr:hypothetical protein [Phormidium tenue FACHB-886]
MLRVAALSAYMATHAAISVPISEAQIQAMLFVKTATDALRTAGTFRSN